MHFYTSATASYIPKARVLCQTIKKYNPDAIFHLVLSDIWPEEIDLNKELFDTVLLPEDFIEIDNIKQWIFKHTVVELCTSVKASAALEIFKRTNADKVIYLDPDIAIFDNLDDLSKMLEDYSIVLTPHLTVPEKNEKGIHDNEICSLAHGIFNLGFVGIRNSSEGIDFLKWWNNRLLMFCYDDIENGIFTDQKWINFVPAFFDNYKIIRHASYNVATWNINSRTLSVDKNGRYFVNGEPLKFFHFTGYDSGCHHEVLRFIATKDSPLFALSRWYERELVMAGQNVLGKIISIYEFYDNGERIEIEHRKLYRQHLNLQKKFPNPYCTKGKRYLNWVKRNRNMYVTNPDIENMLKVDIFRKFMVRFYRFLIFLFPTGSQRRAFVKTILKRLHLS